MDIIKIMRERLVPQGTSDLVKLQLSPASYFEKAHVDDYINDLEKKSQQAAAGLYEFTPLDKLALKVLGDSTLY